jgi:hypothetical protein
MTLCAVCTMHEKTISAGFLVELQNQGQRFGFKTTGMVCRWFGLKTTGTVSPGLASKSVVIISPSLT